MIRSAIVSIQSWGVEHFFHILYSAPSLTVTCGAQLHPKLVDRRRSRLSPGVGLACGGFGGPLSRPATPHRQGNFPTWPAEPTSLPPQAQHPTDETAKIRSRDPTSHFAQLHGTSGNPHLPTATICPCRPTPAAMSTTAAPAASAPAKPLGMRKNGTQPSLPLAQPTAREEARG